MTLGDIIKEYLEDHTVNQFLEDSGLSKAYTYNLINNKNTMGKTPTPTIDTINKVAKGVHSDFDTIFAKLDPDIIISTPSADTHMLTYGKRIKTNSFVGVSSIRIGKTKFYDIYETTDGVVRFSPNKKALAMMRYLDDPDVLRLLDAAKDCSSIQIETAISVLKAFKKSDD